MRKTFYLVVGKDGLELAHRKHNDTIAKIVAPSVNHAIGVLCENNVLQWVEKSLYPWAPNRPHYELSDAYLRRFWECKEKGTLMEFNYYETTNEAHRCA